MKRITIVSLLTLVPAAALAQVRPPDPPQDPIQTVVSDWQTRQGDERIRAGDDEKLQRDLSALIQRYTAATQENARLSGQINQLTAKEKSLEDQLKKQARPAPAPAPVQLHPVPPPPKQSHPR